MATIVLVISIMAIALRTPAPWVLHPLAKIAVERTTATAEVVQALCQQTSQEPRVVMTMQLQLVSRLRLFRRMLSPHKPPWHLHLSQPRRSLTAPPHQRIHHALLRASSTPAPTRQRPPIFQSPRAWNLLPKHWLQMLLLTALLGTCLNVPDQFTLTIGQLTMDVPSEMVLHETRNGLARRLRMPERRLNHGEIANGLAMDLHEDLVTNVVVAPIGVEATTTRPISRVVTPTRRLCPKAGSRHPSHRMNHDLGSLHNLSTKDRVSKVAISIGHNPYPCP